MSLTEMSTSPPKNELIKHSAAVHITGVLSLQERKISNILLNHAMPFMGKREEHTISIRDICHALNIPDNKNYDMLKNHLRSLSKTHFEWNILNKDKKNKWSISSILASVEIENGICTYSYSSAMKKIFSNPNIYAKLNMAIQANFSSKYSIVLWEYLMEFISTSYDNKGLMIKNQISLEDMRKLLGVDNSKYYQEFSNFNREILKRAVLEINQISDLEVDVNYIRQNKKVEYIEFFITKNFEKSQSLPFLSLDEIPKETYKFDEKIKLVEELINNCSFSKMKAENLINEYGYDKVSLVIKYAKDKKPKNIAAYISKALVENWVLENESSKSFYSEEKLDQDILKHIELFTDPIWKEVLKDLHIRYGEGTFKSWFMLLSEYSYDNNSHTITILGNKLSKFQLDWLKSNYEPSFINAFMKHMENIEFIKFQSIIK